MPLVRDYNEVKDIYQEAGELGTALPVFCAEDRETLEAILASALKMSEETGVKNLPIIPAWTCRYPGRGQMTLMTACGDPVLGTKMMFSDLELFMGENSPYRHLRVLPHLDHAFPWLDGDILNDFADQFASVMFDASEKPFEENMRLTAEYVERMKGKVVIEGAVDEIYESGGEGEKNEATTVAQAQEFLSKTGVDIIVPNVGTEHRATADQVNYRSERAREISNAVGKIMCLHGTSSVKPQDLSSLPADGFVKINVYTTLAVHGGQALAREVMDNLENIIDKPKLNYVCNPRRRAAWFTAVRDRCYDFLKIFNGASGVSVLPSTDGI
jgi:fructose-bisphosphate aldolase class II